MTLEEVQDLIKIDKDFIYSKKFDFSIKNLLDKHPNGVNNKTIAQVLLMTEEEVEKIANKAIIEIRKKMKVDL